MKLLVATEKEPSFTARLTPNQIGELLAKCSKEQLYTAIGAATFNVGAYGTDKQKSDLAEVLLSTGNSFKSNLESADNEQ